MGIIFHPAISATAYWSIRWVQSWRFEFCQGRQIWIGQDTSSDWIALTQWLGEIMTCFWKYLGMGITLVWILYACRHTLLIDMIICKYGKSMGCQIGFIYFTYTCVHIYIYIYIYTEYIVFPVVPLSLHHGLTRQPTWRSDHKLYLSMRAARFLKEKRSLGGRAAPDGQVYGISMAI